MKPFPKKFFGLLMIYLCHFRWQIGCFLIFMILGISFENLNIRFFSDIIGALKDNDFNTFGSAIVYFSGCVKCVCKTYLWNIFHVIHKHNYLLRRKLKNIVGLEKTYHHPQSLFHVPTNATKNMQDFKNENTIKFYSETLKNFK